MKTIKTIYRAAMLIVAVTMLAATAPAGALANEMDSRIESSARDSYVFQKYLKDDDVKIESSDGIVNLSGTVTEASHKSLAQETVASLPGVKKVVNHLEIKGEPVAENSDTWITTKVKTALLFHRNVSVLTEVETKDGIVTLEGEAASAAQKDLTTEYVRDVEGVKDVQNKMNLANKEGSSDTTIGEKIGEVGDSIDDASVTGLAKMVLMYHRSTSALATKVVTNNGVVTVSGTAKSAAEKDLVTKYVQDVYGVKSVVNNITVEKPIAVKKPKAKRRIEGC